MRLHSAISTAILVVSYGLSLQGGTVYNEATQGDLSNSGLSPTPITVTSGSNQIFGTTGRGANGLDRDYFTITVPTGLQLTSIMELAGTSVGGAVSFIGIQAGNQVTVSPNATDATGLLGWSHYGGATTDTDLLPAMSIPDQGSSGFTRPLDGGTYSFWIQDFNAGSFSYGFDLVLAPAASSAPEPQSYAMMLSGFLVLAFLCKCRRQFLTNLLRRSKNSSCHSA
jgi:outer membrane scaffolding protein for murein synthesis (MipA/OmpV family)